jgi:phosphate starvation-inducible PhoH-like protein
LTQAVVRKIQLDGPREWVQLCGEREGTIHALRKSFEVQLVSRGDEILVSGPPEEVARATQVIERLRAGLKNGPEGYVSTFQVEQAIAHEKNPAAVPPEPDPASGDVILVSSRKKPIAPKTTNQRRYVEAMRKYDVVFGIGPAGTGKTYLAMTMAVSALRNGEVHRLVLTRPAVEAGEKLGFLPGDFQDKVDPYLRPLYDALYDMVEYDKLQRLFQQKMVEVAPLAYMRGRTLSNAFIILDEAQNTKPEQMKMFLTRMGVGSKMVVTGDVTQVDLPLDQVSGLIKAREVLTGVKGIAFVDFDKSDVVRHPLVAHIIDAYEMDDKKNPGPNRGGGGR